MIKIQKASMLVFILMVTAIVEFSIVAQENTPITPDNAHLLQLASAPDRGLIQRLLWLPDGQTLMAQTSLGAWFYDLNQQNTPPALLQDASIYNVSPDRKWAAGNNYRTSFTEARVWSIDEAEYSPEPAFILDASMPAVFSPDSNTLVTSSYMELRQNFDLPLYERNPEHIARLQVWNTKTGERLARLGDHDFQMVNLSFNGNGTRLISTDYSSTHLWDMSSPRTPVEIAQFPFVALNAVFEDNDQLLLVTEARDADAQSAQLELWRYSEQNVDLQLITRIEADTLYAAHVALSQDKTTLAWHISEGIYLWNVTSNHPIASFEGNDGVVVQKPDATLVGVIDNQQETTSSLYAPSGEILATYDNRGNIILAAANPVNDWIAVSDKREIWLWDVRDAPFEQEINFAPETSAVPPVQSDFAVVLSSDGRWQAVINDSEVILKDAATGDTQAILPAPQGGFSENFKEYQEQQGNTGPFTPQPGRITGVAFSPDTQMLISGGYRYLDYAQHGFAQVWRVSADGNAELLGDYYLGQFRNRVDNFVFDPSANKIALSAHWDDSCLRGSSGAVLLDLVSKETFIIDSARWSSSFSFSPDGRLLAVGGADEGCLSTLGRASLYDVHNREIVHELQFAQGVSNVTFDPTGHELHVRLNDNTHTVWAVE
jgi:WD40 repeat protein